MFSFSGALTVPERNERISKMLQQVSPQEIEKTLRKMESFGSRLIYSKGIEEATNWLYSKLRSYELKVYFDSYRLKAKGKRVPKDVEIKNVVGVLKGNREEIILIGAHYDSIALIREKNSVKVDFRGKAPGVNDDGTGVAAVLEIARLLSRRKPEATIYFALFSAEEEGLIGSTLLAEKLKKEGKKVIAAIAVDMIGNIKGANGIIINDTLRVFTPSPTRARELGKYYKRISEKYLPDLKIKLIFRLDRFGRGGDHIPFVLEGFPGIRIVEAIENYKVQHTAKDTFENISLSYCVKNIKSILSVVASLAFAPPAPTITDEKERPMISRGKTGYDALLKWRMREKINDLWGFKIYLRDTTTPFWQKVFYTQKNSMLLRNLSIDNYVFAVAAIDLEGNESLPAVYVMPPRRKAKYEVYK